MACLDVKSPHPQTNGMVDRFNGRISEVLATTRFDSAQSLEDTLSRYVRLYNHQIPHRALGHLSPVQALKDWQDMRPELFKKKVYNHTGLDTLLMLNNFWRNSMGRLQSEIQAIIITKEAPRPKLPWAADTVCFHHDCN